MPTCDICLKAFKRSDNLKRHMKTKHSDEEEESGSEHADAAEDGSDVFSDNGDELSTGSEGEGDDDPWQPIVDTAFEQCQYEYEKQVNKLRQKNVHESEARRRVYEDMKSVYRKAVMKVFMDRMVWFTTMQQDSVYKAVKRTAGDLNVLDDFGKEEAWKSATTTRKYLFDKILEAYDPSETDDDDDEPPVKQQKSNTNSDD